MNKTAGFFFFGWNSANFSLWRSASFGSVHVRVLLSHPSTCLSTVSISLLIHLSNLSNYASIYVSNLAITQSIRLSIHSSVYIFICPFIYLPMYLFIHISCLVVHLSICICLPTYHIDLLICLSIYLSIYSVKINWTCTRCIVMFSSLTFYSGQLSLSDLTQGPCRMHCIHQVSQVLYIHMYFNTVPQIVEEQHCFQTLCNLNTLFHKNHCKDQQLKTCFVQEIVSSGKNLYKRSVHCHPLWHSRTAVFIVGS